MKQNSGSGIQSDLSNELQLDSGMFRIRQKAEDRRGLSGKDVHEAVFFRNRNEKRRPAPNEDVDREEDDVIVVGSIDAVVSTDVFRRHVGDDQVSAVDRQQNSRHRRRRGPIPFHAAYEICFDKLL